MSKPVHPADTTTTAINIGDQDAAIILPQGYDPKNITVIRPDSPPDRPILPAKKVEVAMDLLDNDSVEASARLQFLRKVYIIVTSNDVIM